ncbi:MAG TPA: STAS domain-containing protein, partial [Planococcus sp. (in: firmicutes)]|nr:STAS domain-containing protein [Planococcus sp. (in: firmicutes)]
RGRLSTLVAGLFLIFLIIVLGDLVVQIPMSVLVGIMIMVAIGTFDWSSFTYLKKAPKTDAAVMVLTVLIVVYTHDLSIGVIAGVVLSAIFFVAKISKIEVKMRMEKNSPRYVVEGQLFFASVEDFLEKFDYSIANEKVIIDFTDAHVWDDSGVGAIDRVVLKFMENQNEVELEGLDSGSKKLVDKLAIFNDANAKLPTH